MVCKMMKKGLLGAALGAGALYLVFGTAAPSYVTTAFHKVRQSAKDSVSIEFDIERAKSDIAALEPAIHDNMETLARAEVDVEHLNSEIDATRKNLQTEKTVMVGLRDKLASGDFRLAKNSNIRLTEDEVKCDLAARLDHYRFGTQILADKEGTLKSRQLAVVSARTKLQDMNIQKRKLAAVVESIQAKLQAIEATEQKNEFHFDDSALARAKQTVTELSKRLEVKSRLAEMEGHFSGVVPTNLDPDRDVLKEYDSEFGGQSKDSAHGDKKSL